MPKRKRLGLFVKSLDESLPSRLKLDHSFPMCGNSNVERTRSLFRALARGFQFPSNIRFSGIRRLGQELLNLCYSALSLVQALARADGSIVGFLNLYLSKLKRLAARCLLLVEIVHIHRLTPHFPGKCPQPKDTAAEVLSVG